MLASEADSSPTDKKGYLQDVTSVADFHGGRGDISNGTSIPCSAIRPLYVPSPYSSTATGVTLELAMLSFRQLRSGLLWRRVSGSSERMTSTCLLIEHSSRGDLGRGPNQCSIGAEVKQVPLMAVQVVPDDLRLLVPVQVGPPLTAGHWRGFSKAKPLGTSVGRQARPGRFHLLSKRVESVALRLRDNGRRHDPRLAYRQSTVDGVHARVVHGHEGNAISRASPPVSQVSARLDPAPHT
jgi:hypothetical protein